MPKDQSYDHLIKLLIVGNSGVGKTNMLLRFCENSFMNSHLTTIGIDFKTKTVNIDNKKIRMQIWDTAGQQRFKTITQTYYRGAMGIFITYAVDDRQSFDEMENWLKQIKIHSTPNVVKILIGNKSDSSKREISYDEGLALAEKIGIPFFETSAKNSNGIDNCFMTMAREVKKSLADEGQIDVVTYTGSKIHQRSENTEKKKKCC